MTGLQSFPVRISNGSHGTVFRKSRFLDDNAFNLLKLDNGEELMVPTEALRAESDGSFSLDIGQADYLKHRAAKGEKPQGAEAHPEEPREAPAQAPVPEKTVNPEQYREAFGTGNFLKEEVNVERVAINKMIDSPAEVRVEGDVTIIPVMEEVLTLEKRLVLREELRITKKRSDVRNPPIISMRKGEPEHA